MTEVGIQPPQARVVPVLRLMRPGAVVASAMICLVGFSLTGPIARDGLIFAVLAVALAVAASNVFNDIVDLEADRINVPHRPLPSGQVSIGFANMWCAGLAGAAMVSALPLGLRHTVWVACVLAVGAWYSARLKKVLIVGELVVAVLLASALVFGASVGSRVSAIVVIGAVEIGLFTFGRETLKGVRDVKGDSFRRVKTIANTWGLKPAVAAFAACCVGVGVTAGLSSSLSHFVVMITLVALPGIAGAVIWCMSGSDLTDWAISKSAWLWATGLAGIAMLGS